MSPSFEKDGDKLAQWLEGGFLEEQENQEYNDVFNDLEKIVEVTDTIRPPSFDKDKLFDRLMRSREIDQKGRSVRMWVYRMTAVAAIGLILMATLFFNQSVNIENGFGNQIVHSLPEGSSVNLFADSKITYAKDFTNERSLNLNGQAFFEVKPGSKFTVQTELGSVTVLGTSFNVTSKNDVFSVACKTGKVSVKCQSKEYILTPGESVSVINKNIMEDKIPVESIGKWSQEESFFSQAPLANVVESLSAWYHIKINIDQNLLTEKFTGSFVHDDLDKALKMVFLPMGLEYVNDDSKTIAVKK
ncbi:MAG: DUF4974 domain-containing protein [Saprospiraceae bacterium]|nr:FecR domain-containing protein [Bacteroidia bacterium]NNE14663.1 DUF4974 domain-containing protein [Saprospiraceae bacterium]NNL91852.1 DUF4974 domain-containing protein [Saprospiraceae bacterium]